jgi:hypothetical protein
LTPEQQQKVRELKAERDKRRNVQLVERNVKAKTEGESAQSDTTTKNSEIGAMMSQRKPVSRDL